MLALSSTLNIFLFDSSSFLDAQNLRLIFQKQRFERILLPIAPSLLESLQESISNLPEIYATVLTTLQNQVAFAPCDPQHPYIEALRQAEQNRIPCVGIDTNELPLQIGDFPRPSADLLSLIGPHQVFEIWAPLLQNLNYPTQPMQRFLKMVENIDFESSAQTLLLLPYAHFFPFCQAYKFYSSRLKKPSSYTPTDPILKVNSHPIHPNHLYFALGQLPFYTGQLEKNRQSLFEDLILPQTLIKQLLSYARQELSQSEHQHKLSIATLQKVLDFTQKLAHVEQHYMPSLFDWLNAAQSIVGGLFASKILEASKFYPFFNIEKQSQWLKVHIDVIQEPGSESTEAIHLWRPEGVEWQEFKFQIPPHKKTTEQYKQASSGHFSCSHIPEDIRIERFNLNIRSVAAELMNGTAKSVEFTSSLKDGLDLRETLRHFHENKLFVKELPLQKKKVDTVVIIFDDQNDELYTQNSVWFAEHPQESTLTFYSTDPQDKMVGPGIGQVLYGGLSLLFPPRQNVINPFEDHFVDIRVPLETHRDRLVWGALMNSNEKAIAYCAEQKPNSTLNRMAKILGKSIIWVPMTRFNRQELEKLRHMHMLENHAIRQFASRFIGL
jgi:hypothetical protein